MAITKASLSAKFKSKLEALYGTAEDDQKFQDFCDAMADAIVEEIQTNLTAVVQQGNLTLNSDGGLVASPPNVTGSEDNITGTIPMGGFL